MATSDRTRLTGRPNPLSLPHPHLHSLLEEPPLPPNAISRSFLACSIAALASTACTIGAASPAPAAPAPTPKDSAAPAPIAAPRWTPARSAGSWRYLLHSTGTVSLAGDSSADSLPLEKTVVYSVTLAPTTTTGNDGSLFQFDGSVDSVVVTIPERIPMPTAGSNSRPHFQGTIAADGHVLAISSNATSPCPGAVDPLSATSTLFFVTLPKGISPGTRWTDSTITTTCRGRLPISTTATRQYTAVRDTSWRGRPALLVVRSDSLTIRSAPESDSGTVAGASSMRVAGHGSGAFTLLVDPSSGTLLESRGTSLTEILVSMDATRFPFREEARQSITLIDPDGTPQRR